MNFYQKYRPAKIGELDLLKVRETLTGLLSGKVSLQAFLFVGPRGAGKTSAARILARTINCLKPGKGEACGRCKACKVSCSPGAVDIIEIDAASHRGIDDIRELRERVRLAPVSLAKKIYIIDEVHMLTKEAFNALLKTLEEPPEFVIFVLCTTEAHKVPETIASRCSKVIFAKASKKEVKRSLGKVIRGEKLKIGIQAVDLLAESVDGSFREGHKLLEQLVAEGDGEIGVEEVRRVLGLVDDDLVKSILGAVEKGEVEKIIGFIKEAEKNGVVVGELVKSCLSFLRCRYEEEVLEGKVGGQTKDLLLGLVDLGGRLRWAFEPFLLVEVLLLEAACRMEKVGRKRNDREIKEKEKEEVERPEEMVVDVQVSKIREEWGSLIEGLKSKNHSVAGLLRSARPTGLSDDCLDVEVFYQFHKDQLEQEVRRVMVEEEAAGLWGIKKVRFNLGDSRVREVTKKDEELVKNVEEVFG